MIGIIEARDGKAAAAFALATGEEGFVRMEIVRAFNKTEMKAIPESAP